MPAGSPAKKPNNFVRGRRRRGECPAAGKLSELAAEEKIDLIVAPLAYCTDNAAMGAIAWERLEAGLVADLSLDVTPGLVRMP